MDRILLAINAAEPGKNALDFACYLAGLTKSRVTGVFLDNQAASLTPLGINKPAMAGADDSDAGLTAAEILEKNINAFRQGCINNEVTCAVHKHHGIPAEDMIKESRFADLIVADAETSFKSHFEGPPSEFVQDLLQKAECPVVIAPSSFDSIGL